MFSFPKSFGLRLFLLSSITMFSPFFCAELLAADTVTRPAVLIVSTAGISQALGGAQFTLVLPAGVSLQADRFGAVSSDVVKASVADGLTVARFLPGTTVSQAKVVIAIMTLSGMPPGELLRIYCDILPGFSITSSSFRMDSLVASDLKGAQVQGGALVSTFIPPDFTPPDLVLSTLADGAATNYGILNISGTVKDDTGVQSLTVNDAPVNLDKEGTFSYALSLTPGPNSVVVTAVDTVGNITSQTRTIFLDQKGPALTISSPSDNVKTRTAVLPLSGILDEPATVTCLLNGGTVKNFSVNGLGFDVSLNLSPGLNTVEVIATDLAGNTTSTKRTILYDGDSPSLAVTYPQSDLKTSRSSMNLRGTVSDDTSSISITATINGIATKVNVHENSYDLSAYFSEQGNYIITITATDEAGNISSVTRNLIYSLPDMDNNGILTIADALMVLRMAVGIVAVTSTDYIRADVAPLINGSPAPDGQIDILDAVTILNRIVEIMMW